MFKLNVSDFFYLDMPSSVDLLSLPGRNLGSLSLYLFRLIPIICVTTLSTTLWNFFVGLRGRGEDMYKLLRSSTIYFSPIFIFGKRMLRKVLVLVFFFNIFKNYHIFEDLKHWFFEERSVLRIR